MTSESHLKQIDTYFRVNHGRLKLRQIESDIGRSAELIQYDRADDAGSRLSIWRCVSLDQDAALDVTRLLKRALGVLVLVRKQRTVAVWHSTRIHLDTVESLGSFVELETLLCESDSDREDGHTEHRNVVEWLGLASLESIAGSYSDLLLLKGQTTA